MDTTTPVSLSADLALLMQGCAKGIPAAGGRHNRTAPTPPHYDMHVQIRFLGFSDEDAQFPIRSL